MAILSGRDRTNYYILTKGCGRRSHTCNIVGSGCDQNEVGSIMRTKLATGSVPE